MYINDLKVFILWLCWASFPLPPFTHTHTKFSLIVDSYLFVGFYEYAVSGHGEWCWMKLILIIFFKLLKIRINHSHVLNSSLFTTLLEWQDMYNGCDNSRQMCADNPFQKAFYKSVIWDAVLYIVSGWVELSTPIMRHRIVYSKWLSWVVDSHYCLIIV